MTRHEQAEVGHDCRIGERTQIHQFASVIRAAVIGTDCTLGACSIVDGALVGDHVAVGHGAQLHPGTRIGNGVFIGPGAIFCNDMWPSADKAGFELPTGRYTVVVEDEASIGAGAIILPGVRIGKGALVAAGAVVEDSLAPGCVQRRNGYISAQRPPNWRDMRMRFAC